MTSTSGGASGDTAPPASPEPPRTAVGAAVRGSVLLKALGPGILFAGAAIGGSHLVQSTRAGAGYGFDLVWIVLLVLLFKYPFFEFSHRYTVATGESLLQGYQRVGTWALVLFSLIALVGSFINAAAVTLVTASLAGALLGLDWSVAVLSVLVVAVVAVILIIGGYNTLDNLMKTMVLLLGVLTLVGVGIAFAHGPAGDPHFEPEGVWTLAGLTFLLALMGWMPAPLDVAVFPSLWTLEKHKDARRRPTWREASFDFHLGYIATVILALAFISFGALVMFGTGVSFSNSGLAFSHQLIGMYTETLGTWSRWIIALVAFITMFSTSLTVYDGYARTLKGAAVLLLPVGERQRRRLYWILLPALMGSGLAVIAFFMSGIKTLIDVATILAFLTAPVVAILNYRVVTGPWIARRFRPHRALRVLAWLGIIYLGGFSAVFLYLKLTAT